MNATDIGPIVQILTGMPVAAVLFYFLLRVMNRSDKREDMLLEAFKSNEVAMTEMRDALRGLTGVVVEREAKNSGAFAARVATNP